jgi:hypothetical protein
MWWDGTVVHYVLNDVAMSHWSYALFPLPLFVTKLMTWASIIWELGFLFLVLYRPTRKYTLYFGIAFHVTISLMVEVGWFGFFTMSLYAAFIPDEYWKKREQRKLSEKGMKEPEQVANE